MRVIVSGAGVAGLALTHWLHRLGVDVLVVEHAGRWATTQQMEHELTAATHSFLGTGVMASIYAVSPDRLALVVYAGAAAGVPPLGDNDAVRDYLLAACAGFSSTITNVLEWITTDDFVFGDVIAQVVMPSIVDGRCVLVGDAAHCPTFLSGMGSSLALQDAYVLAGCLARDQLELSAYEQTVAPIAQQYRESARGAHAMFLAGGPLKSRLRNVGLGLIPERVLAQGARKFIDAERPLAEI